MIQPYDDEAVLNPSTATPMRDLIESRVSRRSVLTGGAAVAAGFFTSGLLAPSAHAGTPASGAPSLLGFTPIGPSNVDEVFVAPGYTARPFLPWGTPLCGDYPAFTPVTGTAAEQEQQVGMNHDGMHYFPLHDGRKGSTHGLLVFNQEYTEEDLLHTGTQTTPPREAFTAEMVRKSQAAHGVTVAEIKESGGEWELVRGRYNRRITANTPMTFSGPAAGHRLVRTSNDPSGMNPVGTINNCANGFTPWGTYLACEENFNGYFRVDPGTYTAEQTANTARYGVGGDRNAWATNDPRFVVTADNPNEPNRFGWVVEIDPFNPAATPVKRTALGRIKHEGAFVHVSKDNRVVVYMGDDQGKEYIYKFVSAGNWKDLKVNQGRSPLDEGTLYVAKFHDNGTGEWLPLVHGHGPLTAGNGFADQGEVLVKTRLAATALGATPMDRPEWTTVDPTTGTVYVTLTNDGGGSKVVSGANPRTPNRWGHILGWNEKGGDHAATTFEWDLLLLAGPGNGVDGSTITAEDAFGSPDGLWADPDGRLWIQTDGSQPSGANNQMLAANPRVTDANGVPEVRRFLTGPIGCEVTGVVCTPDHRTMFVNIQHPGENGGSTWPRLDGITIPRSATLVITKDDGGVIGS